MIKAVADGYELHYGELVIPFRIQNGVRKRLSLTVFPEGRLRVLAPENAPPEAVLERVDRRAKWIVKQWRFFSESEPLSPPRQYVSGETHWYLGRQYRLKVRRAEKGEIEGVKLRGRFFWITVRTPQNANRVQKLLDDWYEAHAKAFLAARLEKCVLHSHRLDLESAPNLVVRRMSKRWGSCTRDGKILLNLDLIKTPVSCIDYVLWHELSHLRFPHHGPEFYRLLSRLLPNWKERKEKLEQWGQKI